MAYFEWKVCNTSEIDNKKFPYLEKSVILQNYFDQAYRLWKTDRAVSVYSIGRFVAVIPLESAGKYVVYNNEDYFKIELLEDGTYDVYHGRVG